MIYGTDFPRFFRLAHGADPFLASIFRAGRCSHGLPFAKAVAGGRNLRCIFYRITVLAVDGLTSCFGAGRRLINRKIRIPAVARGRNLCRIFYCITVLAVDGLTSCFGAGRRLINRKI